MDTLKVEIEAVKDRNMRLVIHIIISFGFWYDACHHNRDLKILDAAVLKNAVTSERAWVVTATFSREKQTLRFALCERWPKRVTTNRFRFRDPAGFAVRLRLRRPESFYQDAIWRK